MRFLPLSTLLFLLQASAALAPATSTFISDDLHFAFTYPAFVVASPADAKPPVPAAQRATQGTAAILDCVSFPLAAQRDGGDTDFDLLTINRLDFKCGKSPAPTSNELRQAARDTVTGPLTGMPGLMVHQPVTYELNGNAAVIVRATSAQGDHRSYAATTCTVVAQNLLCWTAFSSSESHVETMLSGPIRFAARDPVPLVPDTVFAQANR